MFTTPDGSFRRFENCAVKLLAKETKWTSLEVITDTTFLETFISKYDFGPVKLPVITGPVKLFCFPLRMGVSKILKMVQ